MQAKVLLAISGGIDSAFSAKLLKDAGYGITAFYAKTHNFEEIHAHNLENIKKICDFLKIDYFVLDIKEKFLEQIIKPFNDAYVKGQTPNPCVLCNQKIKFGEFISKASTLGYDFLATGHYAKTDGKFLYEALDKKKDQSYFLYGVNKEYLPNILFPLSDKLKQDVKDEALKIKEFAALSTQKESSEICFAQNGYIEVLKSLGTNVDAVGDVLNSNNKIIGRHKGYLQYTIGQRKGFDAPLLQTPHYVTAINAQTNQITVAEREFLYAKEFCLTNENWFKKQDICSVKTRYQAPKISCEIIDNKVILAEAAFAITKGQSAVFYDGDKVLGGAEIA